MSNTNQNNPERKNITSFLKNLGEENYAEANKYLKKTIENKLFNKIKGVKDINIFTNEQ